MSDTKPRRRSPKRLSQDEWDAVDFSRPHGELAAEMGVSRSSVCVEARKRGNRIYLQGRIAAIDLLREVDADNQRVVAAMKSAGKPIPSKTLDLINRIREFLS